MRTLFDTKSTEVTVNNEHWLSETHGVGCVVIGHIIMRQELVMNAVVFSIRIQCKLMKIWYLLLHFEIMDVGYEKQ